ncbi:Endoribonuclease L-PSP [Gracilaria domingensis]|nr:Endoribonuclease L-PSP [Gracilaria domingensis]
MRDSTSAFVSSLAPSRTSRASRFSTSPALPRRQSIARRQRIRAVMTENVRQHSDIKRFLPGPRFNQIVVHNGVVYLAGQVARGTDGSVAAQTRAILAKIDDLLEQAGTDKSRLLTTNIWIADMSKFSEMNGEWEKWVDKDNMPVRACVQSTLADDSITVEIQATAALPSPAKVIATDEAAAAVGPYNQGVVVDDGTVYVSGCIGLMPRTGIMAGDSIEEQTKQALQNMKSIVEAAGASVQHIVKTTILLDDIADFAAVNVIYSKFFDGGPVPARSCFAAKQLPKSALVEIECIAKLQ